MVVGNGLIASAFIEEYANDDRYVIFASGVSNSSETNDNEFKRERDLLVQTIVQNPDKHLVYFTSFIDSRAHKSLYLQHKIRMEEIIMSSKNYYTILKLPQIVGRLGNNFNFFNFIVNKINNNENITVYVNTYKSLIDVEDVKRIVDVLIKKWSDKNTYVNFPYIEKMSAHDIILLIAKRLNKTPILTLIESDKYDLPECRLIVPQILKILNIDSSGYTEKVINKYI